MDSICSMSLHPHTIMTLEVFNSQHIDPEGAGAPGEWLWQVKEMLE